MRGRQWRKQRQRHDSDRLVWCHVIERWNSRFMWWTGVSIRYYWWLWRHVLERCWRAVDGVEGSGLMFEVAGETAVASH